MELVLNLLANNARVDVFDIECRSALHLASEHGYLQVCDALLTNKAFINSKSRVVSILKELLMSTWMIWRMQSIDNWIYFVEQLEPLLSPVFRSPNQ